MFSWWFATSSQYSDCVLLVDYTGSIDIDKEENFEEKQNKDMVKRKKDIDEKKLGGFINIIAKVYGDVKSKCSASPNLYVINNGELKLYPILSYPDVLPRIFRKELSHMGPSKLVELMCQAITCTVSASSDNILIAFITDGLQLTTPSFMRCNEECNKAKNILAKMSRVWIIIVLVPGNGGGSREAFAEGISEVLSVSDESIKNGIKSSLQFNIQFSDIVREGGRELKIDIIPSRMLAP